MIIKELPKTFTKGDKTFTQITKNSKGYIYEVSDSEVSTKYYEVFKRKLKTSYDWDKNEKMTDCKYVQYPSNEDFGNFAWCIVRDTEKNGLAAAVTKFVKITL